LKHPEKIKELFKRYLTDECSREEVRLLLQHFVEENEILLKSLIRTELEALQNDKADSVTKENLDKIYQKIKKKLKKKNK
jgi:hypothetical protein